MSRLIRILNILRLAGFPLAYGLTGALIGGTLNRIMIADLAISATLVGLFFATPYLISPIRVWLGYRSDGFPIFGKRREPYIVAGVLVLATGILLAVLSTNAAVDNPVFLLGILAAFVIYGIGRNLAHNSFEALLADTFTGDQRPRAMTIYEVVTLLGSVIGAGLISRSLENYEPGLLLNVAIGVAVAVTLLTLLAALGNEPTGETAQKASAQARRMPFGQVIREVVLADPQVRIFFSIILFTFIGTLAQDVLLEPFGALALNMTVGETSRLTMFWGLGVMASMLLSGTILIKFFGYMNILRSGLIVSMLAFLGVIVSGAGDNPALFQGLVVVMGLGTGLAGAGLLTGFISFTTAIRAGLLMGVWGMANLLGRAAGSLMGGGVVDLTMLLSGGNADLAYSMVFGIEIAMLITAFALTYRLNLATSRAQTEVQSTLAPAAATD